MIALDLQLVVFLGLLGLAATACLAVLADRRLRAETRRAYSSEDLICLRTALDTAPFGFLLLSPQSAVHYTNARARQLLGLVPGDAVLPEAPWRAEFDRDLEVTRPCGELQTHYRTVAMSPEMVLSWWMCPLPTATIVFLLDATRQFKSDQVARMFLSNLSHELRTPLTAILTHLAVLRSVNTPEPARQASLEIIHQEANRMARLVPVLLDLSRLEVADSFNLRPVDLVLVVEDAMAQLILEAEARGISLTLDVAPPLPRILGDPDQLKQVFLNLLDNSLKYGRRGDKVEVSLCPQRDTVHIEVRDTGPGIPAEHLPKVSQQFYRGRTDVAGSGLGLALVREILRHHRSHLKIESQAEGEHTGTTVSFVLLAA